MSKEIQIDNFEEVLNNLELHLRDIGEVLANQGYLLARNYGIRATGDFMDNIGNVVSVQNESVTLILGSNVEHERYVLGGKVPSWTPLEPLRKWVETKQLSWTDKKTGKELTVDQMARMIRHKIKEKGIEERNIFLEVWDKNKEWVYNKIEQFFMELQI